MISKPIVYDENDNKVVEEYENDENKCSSFWNLQDNKNLENLKKKIKKYYLKIQNYTCCYCKQTIIVDHGGSWDIEHIISKSVKEEFMFTPENLALSCKDCNTIKGAKNVLKNPNRKTFPDLSSDYIIVHPHFDHYFEHISWLEKSMIYYPKENNAKGVNTIEVCRLDRFLFKKINLDGEDLDSGYFEAINDLNNRVQEAETNFEKAHCLKLLNDVTNIGLAKLSGNELSKYNL
ncbi:MULTISPECIES: HNH endonuclease [unclassified Marinomonas]|uniref:HNH endonuclease n=1 Tax=unclassified Marinomonas TaxID=196814 RepID=UPI0007AF7953|nr:MULTISPECIES: HNH endonuclease [unclassified Marinomonas]